MHTRSINFATYSSIRIGPNVEVAMIEPGDAFPSDRYLIGGANNLLLSPTPPPLMMLAKDFAYIHEADGLLEIGAAMPSGRIVSYARKHDIGGFEFCAKLPGTLGGMLAMNAGVKTHETFDRLAYVKINNQWIPKEAIPHGYRYADLGGIATAARFSIERGFDARLLKELAALRANQPRDPSAGSAFKNPPNDAAGRLIEAVGLRGHRHGGMAWSAQHANFLVNLGNGTYDEAIHLIELAKTRVNEHFGILLEEEIKILNHDV